MKQQKRGARMCRSLLGTGLLAAMTLCCSCAAKHEPMPLVCERMVFFAVDGKPMAEVFFSHDESTDERSACYSAKTASALIQKLLHTETRILYKPVKTIVFENSLSSAQKQALLKALFDQTEFQLLCKAFEVADRGDPLTEATTHMSLGEYFRVNMNRF